MTLIQKLIDELRDGALAANVENAHHAARMAFPMPPQPVTTAEEFEHEIGRYVKHHVASCIAPGAQLPDYEAIGRAKAILTQVYRRRNHTLLNAVADAIESTNGGMRAICDHLADGLRAESVEHYIEEVIDRHIRMDSWPDRVSAMHELMDHFGTLLPESIRNKPAEQFASASDYKVLLRAVMDALRQSASAFRRV